MSSATARLKQSKDQITATVEQRVNALVDGDIDERAVGDMLGALGAVRVVVAQLATTEGELAELTARDERLRAGMAKAAAASPGDRNRLRERAEELAGRIAELETTRTRLIDNLVSLTSRLRAG